MRSSTPIRTISREGKFKGGTERANSSGIKKWTFRPA